ncbi:UNVERIFIED_CONTAM: hypothetical protein Sradi_2086700 [Sesamum radiatum]|uniref:Uncharacterized protein n=1 Tax=Sesamum radiatum TaxID=300843 RepID=A0AAW2TIG1_SESRA
MAEGPPPREQPPLNGGYEEPLEPSYGKGSFIVHALAVASARSMGFQSQFPRYACPVVGIDRFKG